MNNIKSIRRIPLVSCIALMTILVCCAAFIGCPETQEMTDGIITPSGNPPPPPAENTPPPPVENTPPPPPPQTEG